MTTRDPTPEPATLDWDEARRFLHRTMAPWLDAAERTTLDDLVQEACVRLLRAWRRTPVRQPEGLMRTIARRTWTDYVRRRSRARRYMVSVESDRDIPDPGSLGNSTLGDLTERIGFVVQEIFDRRGADECKQLSIAFFNRVDWSEIAAESGISHAAVRKRWSRCLSMVREILAGDPDFSDLMT